MKVIVKVSGFYGGTWYNAKDDAQVMPDAVAKAFLPPYGDQLSVPVILPPINEQKPSTRKKAG
jgi:hypothetical protein